jgi:hypothetical protein
MGLRISPLAEKKFWVSVSYSRMSRLEGRTSNMGDKAMSLA